MIRLALMGHRWVGIEVVSVDIDAENAQTFVNESTPVMYVYELDDIPEDMNYEMVD